MFERLYLYFLQLFRHSWRTNDKKLDIQKQFFIYVLVLTHITETLTWMLWWIPMKTSPRLQLLPWLPLWDQTSYVTEPDLMKTCTYNFEIVLTNCKLFSGKSFIISILDIEHNERQNEAWNLFCHINNMFWCFLGMGYQQMSNNYIHNFQITAPAAFQQ